MALWLMIQPSTSCCTASTDELWYNCSLVWCRISKRSDSYEWRQRYNTKGEDSMMFFS